MKDKSMKSEDEHCIYCAIMGDGMVGKTSISDSFAQKTFTEEYEATVFENYVVPLNLGGEEFAISMFDTAGQKNFENLRCFTFKESEVLILCFSTCDRQSFTNITDEWMSELKRHTKQTKQKRPVILVGTQIDLRVGDEDSEVNWDEGVQLAKNISADCYVECSARDQKGLEEVFKRVVCSALKFRKKSTTNIFKQIFKR